MRRGSVQKTYLSILKIDNTLLESGTKEKKNCDFKIILFHCADQE